MNEAQFASRFTDVAAKLEEAKNSYEFKTGESWSNIGTNPLDLAFTELTELYLNADDIQRKRIFDYSATAKLSYNLWYFIRRVGMQIHSQNDWKWLEVGLAAAFIDGVRGDFRDIIISLVLLRFAAEMHGIDTKPYFEDKIQAADDQLRSILKNVRDHDESDIHFTVQTSGQPELATKSIEMYGKHPSVSSMEEWQKDKKQVRVGLRNVIILFVILGLFALWNYLKSGG